jgi:hypothetical protein
LAEPSAGAPEGRRLMAQREATEGWRGRTRGNLCKAVLEGAPGLSGA